VFHREECQGISVKVSTGEKELVDLGDAITGKHNVSETGTVSVFR
jgi:hypothetical protein